jgi:ABC-type branched-subunit amino acid transport system substrate-binding protein
MAPTPYRKYYIVCQDYSWGHDVARAFKEQMKIYKPDAQIVGEDYHPIATKDFGPYITKVVQAKADAIFTGNWASDARLLVKQARQLGLKSPFPMVMIFGVDPYIENELQDDAIGIHFAYDYVLRVETPENAEFIKRYREVIGKHEKDFMTWWPAWSTGTTAIGWMMTFAAVEKAGSLDPEKIIDAFEGMWYKSPVGWKHMRKCDHQIIGPMFGGKVEAGWNPWFNGSIDPKIKFPWLGKVKMFPATESAIPPTSDYNKRCP